MNVTQLYSIFIFIRVIHEITGKRGFSVSRSTFVSSGHYGAHWLGDNASKWPHMKLSIIGMIEMNLFGIPFVWTFTSNIGSKV